MSKLERRFYLFKNRIRNKSQFLVYYQRFSRKKLFIKWHPAVFLHLPKRNGSEKTNQQTRLKGNEYYITTKGKTEVVRNYPIRNNLLSMYCCEPKLIGSIYSDYFQQNLPLEKIGDSKYKSVFQMAITIITIIKTILVLG
ncbi:MAG: hypothetical protein IPP43_00800 [Chitinophagaceae bacterium]|nr:hypothetical protein [Chitinophagaceae bacterium]